jgi:hypothetical protein
VHWTGGYAAAFQAVFWLQVFSAAQAESHPTHQRVTPAVGCCAEKVNTFMQTFQKILIVAMVGAFLISACGNNAALRSRATEEAAVYSTLLNDELAEPFGYLLGDPIIIVDRTYKNTFYETIDDKYLLENASALDKETVEDFHTVNIDSQIIDLPLSVGKPYEYIRVVTESDWEQLKNYPNAISITNFSKIGFNQKLDQALVYMAFYCGTECGKANIYFLVRKGDIWEIKNVINVWVS